MDIEQPACFYLGREYDLATRTVLDTPVMYDARDLTTHGVVVGMTGSGKTGLCINLLEEAAIDGIPCIIIDPKGDLCNLLLQFPHLAPEDFFGWLNPEDARQRGVSLEEHGRELAERWRKGLAEWGQQPQRIQRLRDSAEWRVYTPGSEAGLPLSILQTFNAPKGNVSREALNQKIDATATALLGLTGISSDPVQSREHILIAQLLLNAWSKGQDMDLPQLITQIQVPPLRKIGAFEVDTFYPEKDRLKLAVALNNILAAPSFSTWITGEPLDLERLLGGGQKPRQLIFYVAHLEDAQRLFFLTLLLEEVLSWTRRQQGTSSLRAILYFDEVFGYLPPHPANPPTKTPLMALLKQARAFGVGILLATQNPVDLDYKALSNAGTWFVGKLQTERDKARLVEGLQGVAAERGTLTDRNHLETVISALGNRVFLLHDVHRGKPLLFQSRWALSFLRGPMTRDQVALLMAPLKEAKPEAAPAPAAEAPAGQPPLAILLCQDCGAELGARPVSVCPHCGRPMPHTTLRAADREFKQGLVQAASTRAAPPAAPSPLAADHVTPVLPAGLVQFYLPVHDSSPAGPMAELVYQPRVLGFAEVVFADKRKGLEHRRSYRLVAAAPTAGQPVAWHAAETVGEILAAAPQPNARWSDVPETLNTVKKLKALEKEFTAFLQGNARLSILMNRTLDLVGEPGEDVVAFQERCRTAAQQEAAKALAAEKARYREKFAALNATLPEDDVERPSGEASKPAAGWLGWIHTISHALDSRPIQVTAPRPPKEQARLTKLEADWRDRLAALYAKWKEVGEAYTEVVLTPRKADVQVTHFGLAWVPRWQ